MTQSKERAIAALLSHPTRTAAAEAAGITPRTLQRYFEDGDFTTAYKRAFAELIQDAVRQAQQTIAPALSAFSDILADESAPLAVKVSAARSVLEYALKLTELNDIVERLEQLEARIEHE